MIQLNHKYDCCGCNACVQKCPKQCISMHEDKEGFLYPEINETICIDCHQCEKVCPVINQNEPRQPKFCYAAYNPDETIRRESSSGGIFTMISEKVLEAGGVVFGARFDERWNVVHGYTETRDGLTAFRGSKYVQSIIGDSYKQTEEFLKEGRKVLFSGTPCQIAGLKLFLRKNYENLTTIDFVCHGVPSPGIFRKYIQEELPPLDNITMISFRDKCSGWKKFSFKYEYQKEGKAEIVTEDLETNSFLKGFLTDLYLRPSCHKCPAKQFKSGADITIADYWGYQNTNELKDDDKGISAIIINTAKGISVYESIHANSYPTTLDRIKDKNGAISHSSTYPYREYFFRQNNKTLSMAVNRITSNKLEDKILRKLFLLTHKPELK